MLKSLLAKGRPKLAPPKVIVKSNQWGRVNKVPRGEENSDNVNRIVCEHEHLVVSALNVKTRSTYTGEYQVHKSQTVVCDENTAKGLNRQLIGPSTNPSRNITSPSLPTKEMSRSGDTINTLESRIEKSGGGIADNSVCQNNHCVSIYDINKSSDKYVSYVQRSFARSQIQPPQECQSFSQLKIQSNYNFGFIPLSDFMLPRNTKIGQTISCPIKQHLHVSASGCPNFMHCRTPVASQLNVDA